MASAAEASLLAQRRGRAGAEPARDIPRISLAPFVGAGSDAAQRATGAAWGAACSEVGFATVVDHGVPASVVERAWTAADALFRLPLEDKARAAMTHDYPYGYQAMGTENLEASLGESCAPGDIKEMFNICLGPADGADVPPVRWPESFPEPLRRDLEDYYRHLERLSLRLYHVCAIALGLPPDWFASRIDRHRNVVRMINYPAQEAKPGQVFGAAHAQVMLFTAHSDEILRVRERLLLGSCFNAHRLWVADHLEAGRRLARGTTGDGYKWRVDRRERRRGGCLRDQPG